jgi:glutamate racemase
LLINLKIGVFDSGIGGVSVADAIKKALPEHQIIFVNDTKNLPYGVKSPDELFNLVVPILQDLVDQGCRVIVIACNTVSTTIINRLRDIIKIPIVGMEPMIKPAAEQTKSGVIAVCATPTTLASKRYAYLKETYAPNIDIIEPNCSDWALMIESENLDRAKIKNIIDGVCAKNADVIVLGCTHYHWIEELINEMAKGRAKVMQPEQPVINQLKQVLKQLP